MYQHIRLGEIPQPMVAAVSVGKVEYFYALKVSDHDMERRIFSERWYLKMFL